MEKKKKSLPPLQQKTSNYWKKKKKIQKLVNEFLEWREGGQKIDGGGGKIGGYKEKGGVEGGKQWWVLSGSCFRELLDCRGQG